MSAEELEVPGVHVGYCFPKDAVGGDYVVVLVARDRETKMTVAHVVPGKGADQEWVAEQVCRHLVKFGHHGDLVLKCDQEPALVDLLREIGRLRGNQRTVLEHSPVADSSGNGLVERAIQSVEKLLRVHKLALESKIKEKLPVKHAAFAWLVEHATDVLNRFAVGRDGKTAVQRLKGKSCDKYSHEFAAPVMFRVCGKVGSASMAERWYSGIWLGKRLGTEEHVVMKEDGTVVRARSVREVDKNLTIADLNVLTGRPHDPLSTIRGVPRDAGRRVDLGDGEGDGGVDEEAPPKRVQITKDVVLRFGGTAGCKKCRGLIHGDKSYRYVHHTEECRIRMEKLMREDEDFKAHVERADRRVAERLSDMLEGTAKAQENRWQ